MCPRKLLTNRSRGGRVALADVRTCIDNTVLLSMVRGSARTYVCVRARARNVSIQRTYVGCDSFLALKARIESSTLSMAAMSSTPTVNYVSCVVWEWQRDDGGFSPYPPNLSAAIEAAYVGRNTQFHMTDYTITFASMRQKKNMSGTGQCCESLLKLC